MQATPTITVVSQTRDRLGECPLWDGLEETLYWVDSVAPCIRRLHPATGELRCWSMPSEVGSIGLSRPGRLVAGLRDGFHEVDLATGAVTPLHRLALPAGLRLNDGRMDRQGRFLCGAMATAAAPPGPPRGVLYRFSHDGALDELEHGIATSNATCFSPAGDRLYFADSRRGVIWRYPYDGETGRVGPREDLVDVEALTGSGPDGATVDAQGRLWVALVRTGQLGCFSDAGALLRVVDLPVRLPTCPAFGGPALDQLYVTSISDSGRLRSGEPEAGALLRLDGLGATGLPEARFGAPAGS